MATDHLRAIAGENWAFRWRVEREAELRFTQMAKRLRDTGASASIVELANTAAGDERRHTLLCAELAEAFGCPVDPSQAVSVPDISPAGLTEQQSLTYEVVAACCIAETESSGTLMALLKSDPPPDPRVKEVLRAIAADEVQHGRLGWAYLAQPGVSQDALSFLAPLIPAMLIPSESLYGQSPGPEWESSELLRSGVLPFSQKREVFSSMLRQVILPGLEKFGIGSGPALEWLVTAMSGT